MPLCAYRYRIYAEVDISAVGILWQIPIPLGVSSLGTGAMNSAVSIAILPQVSTALEWPQGKIL